MDMTERALSDLGFRPSGVRAEFPFIEPDLSLIRRKWSRSRFSLKPSVYLEAFSGPDAYSDVRP